MCYAGVVLHTYPHRAPHHQAAPLITPTVVGNAATFRRHSTLPRVAWPCNFGSSFSEFENP